MDTISGSVFVWVRWKMASCVGRLPYCGKYLSKLLTTQEEQELLDKVGVELAAALATQAEVVNELKARSPAVAYWVTREKSQDVEGGPFLVHEALVIFSRACGIEKVGPFFDQFVVDRRIFQATMWFFFELPVLFRESGYTNQDGEIAPEDQEAANQLFLNQLTTTIVNALPGRFEWTALRARLKDLFSEKPDKEQ